MSVDQILEFVEVTVTVPKDQVGQVRADATRRRKRAQAAAERIAQREQEQAEKEGINVDEYQERERKLEAERDERREARKAAHKKEVEAARAKLRAAGWVYIPVHGYSFEGGKQHSHTTRFRKAAVEVGPSGGIKIENQRPRSFWDNGEWSTWYLDSDLVLVGRENLEKYIAYLRWRDIKVIDPGLPDDIEGLRRTIQANHPDRNPNGDRQLYQSAVEALAAAKKLSK